MRLTSNRGRTYFKTKPISSMWIESKYDANLSDNDREFDGNSMLKYCFMQKYETDPDDTWMNCDLFQPVVTDMGICSSYNPTPMTELMKKSHFMDSFKSAYNEDFISNYSLNYGEKLGKTLKLFLGLTPIHPKQEIEHSEVPVNFYVGISSSKEFFEMKLASDIVKAGYRTVIRVEPTEIVASEDLRSIQISKRKCHFEDELDDLKLFSKYSQSGCQFEKQIRTGMEKCKCAPWFIPSTIGQNYTMCDLNGNYCFDEITKHFGKHPECLPSYNLVQFSQNMIVEKLDPTKECQNPTVFSSITSWISNSKGFSNLFEIQKLEDWLNFPTEQGNGSFYSEKQMYGFCQYMVANYIAEVNVKFGIKKYIRTKMSVKVSFTDRLGSFGKERYKLKRKNDTIYHFRWNTWIVHRNEYPQHGGDYLLVHEDIFEQSYH